MAAGNNRFGFELLGSVRQAGHECLRVAVQHLRGTFDDLRWRSRRHGRGDGADAALRARPGNAGTRPSPGSARACALPATSPPTNSMSPIVSGVHSGAQFNDPFLKTTRENYGAGIQPARFPARIPRPARKTINTWVEEQTKDKIKELIRKGEIDGEHQSGADQRHLFQVAMGASLHPGTHQARGLPPARRRHRQGADDAQTKTCFVTAETDDIEVVDMPYRTTPCRWSIVLPKKVDGLAAVEKDLNAARLGEMLEKLKPDPRASGIPEVQAAGVVSARGDAGGDGDAQGV